MLSLSHRTINSTTCIIIREYYTLIIPAKLHHHTDRYQKQSEVILHVRIWERRSFLSQWNMNDEVLFLPHHPATFPHSDHSSDVCWNARQGWWQSIHHAAVLLCQDCIWRQWFPVGRRLSLQTICRISYIRLYLRQKAGIPRPSGMSTYILYNPSSP